MTSHDRLIRSLKRAGDALRAFGRSLAPLVEIVEELPQYGSVDPDDMTVDELREVAAYLSAARQHHDAVAYRCEANRRERRQRGES